MPNRVGERTLGRTKFVGRNDLFPLVDSRAMAKTAKKKPAPKPKKAPKQAARKPARAKKAAPAKKTAAKKVPAKKAHSLDDHPEFARLIAKLKPGRHAGGMLLVTAPGAHDDEMGPWLNGNTDGRRSIGRTAFGNIVVFRDLRSRAEELDLDGAATACDVSIIDIHYKRMVMIAETVDGLLASLDDRAWQDEHLRGNMYREVKARVGDYADDECLCFVPALAFGGSDDATSVERANWLVHQALLIQM